MGTRKIKVLIVDDHDVVRKGFSILLNRLDDIDVIGSTGDWRMALTFCMLYEPDVVLLDMRLPHMSGIDATQLIHNRFPDIQIVALSSSVDDTQIYEVLQAGAISYLLKTGTINELVGALRAAYHGIPTLAQEVTAVLISATRQQPKLGNDLTQREREILAYMTDGSSNRDIAQQLTLSTSTVKNHVSNIFSKLDADSRTKVVALAVEHHLSAQVSSKSIKKGHSTSALLPV